MEKPEGEYALEFRLRHKDGSYRWITARASFALEPDGRRVRLLSSHMDITDRKRAEEQLQRTLGELRTLSRKMDVVREEERTRIARELHDELGVRLTCLKLDLARLQFLTGGSQFLRAKMKEKVHSMMADIDPTIASVQRLVVELRPGILDDLGLVAAIEWQCQDFERRSGTPCVCKASQQKIVLDGAHATAAFRICQEALTNVARHAKARSVRVLIEQVNGELLLEIQDDGQGIRTEQLNGVGLVGSVGDARTCAGSRRPTCDCWPAWKGNDGGTTFAVDLSHDGLSGSSGLSCLGQAHQDHPTNERNHNKPEKLINGVVMLKILIADDHSIFRRGVKELLSDGLGDVTVGRMQQCP